MNDILIPTALKDNIVVKPVYVEHSGKIEIPKSALQFKKYDANVYGYVVSVGKDFGLRFKGDNLKQGDIVIFQRHEGKRFIYERETYLKLKPKWVLAKVVKPSE